MADSAPQDDNESKSETPAWVGCLTLVVIAAAVVGLFLLGWPQDAVTWIGHRLATLGASDVPPKRTGNWLDRVVGADEFVGVLRIIVFAFAVWAVLSVIANIARASWISEVGPQGLKAKTREVTESFEETNKELAEATERNDELETMASQLNDASVQLYMLASALRDRAVEKGVDVSDIENVEFLDEDDDDV